MKTNHRRRFKEKRASNAVAGKGYWNVVLRAVAMDGSVVEASSTTGDHTNGKHGIARDRAGAKKFVRSRIRRRDRDALKKLMTEVDS